MTTNLTALYGLSTNVDSGGCRLKSEVITSSKLWIKPSGVETVKVLLVGGGGGGGAPVSGRSLLANGSDGGDTIFDNGIHTVTARGGKTYKYPGSTYPSGGGESKSVSLSGSISSLDGGDYIKTDFSLNSIKGGSGNLAGFTQSGAGNTKNAESVAGYGRSGVNRNLYDSLNIKVNGAGGGSYGNGADGAYGTTGAVIQATQAGIGGGGGGGLFVYSYYPGGLNFGELWQILSGCGGGGGEIVIREVPVSSDVFVNIGAGGTGATSRTPNVTLYGVPGFKADGSKGGNGMAIIYWLE